MRTARDAGCERIVVVLGAAAEEIRERSNLGDAVVVVNDKWAEGMATSIRAGIAASAGAGGVILMTCDQPAVTSQHLRALAVSGEVTASSYVGQLGVPAYFPAASMSALMNLTGDMGARELLRGAPAIELANGELDVDTSRELARARELFG